MERTYNVFVDNGLYVLAYYLEKEVEDITYEDIENSVDMMSKKIKEFTSCDKYTNLKSMAFANSTLTQTKSKVTLDEKLKLFSKMIKGNEYCAICGQYHANIINDETSRSYIPNAPAHTFFNFSNNLKGINICPHCLILTVYSILNMRVAGLSILYNSDLDDFLETYTLLTQEENMRDILSNAKKVKETGNFVDNFTKTIKDLLHYKKVYDDGYVEQHLFNNSGQSQEIEHKTVNQEGLEILNLLENKSLLDEFIDKYMMKDLLEEKLSNNYIYRLVDFNKGELKCSKELFNLLHDKVNDMSKDIVDIINSIANKIKKEFSNEKIENIILDLKNLNRYLKFENLIVDLIVLYKDMTGENLITSEEFQTIASRMKYMQIKNLMIVNLVVG